MGQQQRLADLQDNLQLIRRGSQTSTPSWGTALIDSVIELARIVAELPSADKPLAECVHCHQQVLLNEAGLCVICSNQLSEFSAEQTAKRPDYWAGTAHEGLLGKTMEEDKLPGELL